ncbi:hypothetical protein QBC38DRAFT_280898 [Podospora fimiseda]|uniref:Allergen n=1 Tax=Podospora fimiseda TaxID=252190 RepID=A0AAN7BKS7_9PEZI|nr:hypothetical protein QBC38DRAFT_280898 [Podospora fimiseda]
MDSAKRAVDDFVSKGGHHDTTTHEHVAPAIQKETIKPTQHEEISTAIDKEVHQDHYHRVEQPIFDKEVLPEKHKSNLGKVVNREFDNRDQAAVERALKAEQSGMRNERMVTDTTRTKSHAPVVQGEHVHHHVHETIQPVVHKETIQPEVVHTTIPIHEVHHNEARIHGTSTLPAVSMDQYRQQGGALGGATERSDAFEGCPKGVSDTSRTGGSSTSRSGTSGISGSSTGISGTSSSTGTSAMKSSSTTSGPGFKTTSTEHTEKKKPSLLDRLNPMKDSDGDGKSGFLS